MTGPYLSPRDRDATESNPSDETLVRAVMERIKSLNSAIDEAHHAGIKIKVKESANVLWQSFLLDSAERRINLIPKVAVGRAERFEREPNR